MSLEGKQGCVFCDIVEGRGDAAAVYEDDTYLAFMDRSPITEGHVLLLPKAHFETLLDMPLEEVGPFFTRVAHLAAAITRAMDADGFNVGQNNGRAANQIVFHVHVHIIPRYVDDSPEGRWPSRRMTSMEDLEAVASRIRRFVKPLPTS